MKLLNFCHNNNDRLGLKIDDKVIDLTEVFEKYGADKFESTPFSVKDFILLGDNAVSFVQDLIKNLPKDITEYLFDDLDIKASLKPNKNIFCVGRNYREHIIEGNIARGQPPHTFPKAIEFFSKPPTTIVGHKDSVLRHAELTDSLDYEVELAIVIGKKCTNAKKESALDYVFGYTIVNDITGRDLQQLHGQWLKGKSLDTTCPIGPVVTHKSAITDANNLRISLKVNDEIRQDDNTSDMIFNIASIIEQLSAGLTLEPGDVIATGTPKGVGFAMTPKACLNVGDVVSASIENIGTLTNQITE